ncbi:TetR/AcrR family transcriptional regulator [Kitasatospora sp. NPDC093558]|uniref:TetR/AcrR family transcriptional regulator n=1 Tax=Kitasatospora sp. NPDC093558 TaxID=3155201 RepID=UPI00343DE336
MDTKPTRRARLRQQTISEIKEAALKALAEAGPAGITLRGIARELGMTAAALYGYFDTRDQLISTLAADAYNELADSHEAALAALPHEETARRVRAVCDTFRTWSVKNPAAFRLIYGDGLPGFTPPEEVAAAARRCCMTVLDVVDGAWEHVPAALRDDPAEWSDFHESLAGPAREQFPHLSPQALGVSLRIWGRMYGPVALEVFGYLGQQINDPAEVYRREVDAIIEMLGIGE